MFWITDGAPTDSTDPVCASNTSSSIDWFRENNVLVLGGLLQPRDEINRAKASQFRPIVTGENCGNFQSGWTRGEVIEANEGEINLLGWILVTRKRSNRSGKINQKINQQVNQNLYSNQMTHTIYYDEGTFYADYQFALMCDSQELKKAFNTYYELKEDDEYYVGV